MVSDTLQSSQKNCEIQTSSQNIDVAMSNPHELSEQNSQEESERESLSYRQKRAAQQRE